MVTDLCLAYHRSAAHMLPQFKFGFRNQAIKHTRTLVKHIISGLDDDGGDKNMNRLKKNNKKKK